MAIKAARNCCQLQPDIDASGQKRQASAHITALVVVHSLKRAQEREMKGGGGEGSVAGLPRSDCGVKSLLALPFH